MRILTTSELNDYLDFVLLNALNYNPRIFFSLLTLKETGCRASELFIQNWLFTGSNEYLLFTLKGGGTRIFENKDLNEYFRNAVEGVNFGAVLNSYPALEYQFTQASQGLTTFTNQKAIRTHTFRHLKMRQLFEDGQTYEQIRTSFALNSLDVVQSYVNSPIYADF